MFLYHSVTDDPSARDQFAVSRATFEAHSDAIAASKRKTLRISDLARALRDNCTFPDRIAAVSFDDGFADTEAAVHSLLDRGLQSTVYVTTGEVGHRDRLTAAQLMQLSQLSSVEIGAHAVHHRYLDELDDPQLAAEVRLSKLQLEDIIQMDVASFAYPHGAYDLRVRQAVIDHGYRSAAAVKNALSHSFDDPYAIARFTVTRGTSVNRILQILDGKSIPPAWSRERARTRAYRTFRRGRARIAASVNRTGRLHP